MIKLSKFARDLGVTKMTLWNWKKAGKLVFHKVGNLNYIDLETYNNFLGIKQKKEERVIIYCRVSSTINKTNLESQRGRMIAYCNARGYQVASVVSEFGSGLNDKRSRLSKVLAEDDFTKIVVEHKDRLTRFGFNYIEILLKRMGKEIEVVNNVEGERDDLIQDFISVITSFSARIYGQRRTKRKTEEMIKNLTLETSEIINKN